MISVRRTDSGRYIHADRIRADERWYRISWQIQLGWNVLTRRKADVRLTQGAGPVMLSTDHGATKLVIQHRPLTFTIGGRELDVAHVWAQIVLPLLEFTGAVAVIDTDDRAYRLGAHRGDRHLISRNVRAWILLTILSVAMISVSPGLAAAGALPAAIDACALLTQDEVSAAVGKRVETGHPYDNGITPQGAHSTTCIWAAPLPLGVEPDPAQRLGGRGFVVLGVINWPGGPSDARKFLEDFHEAFGQHDIDSKPVTVDVGADDSLWWGDGVAVRKNGVSFGISVAQFGDRAARQPEAESLAKLIVKRLPI